MRDSRAVAKLTNRDRCELFAFILCGVPEDVLVVVFEVGVRTVWRIKAASPKSYPAVFHAAWNCNSEWEYCNEWITEERELAVRKLYQYYHRPLKPERGHVWVRFP